MNNEFPTYDDFKEIKDKYDELKQLYLTLQREKNLFEESYGDVSARLVEAQKDRDMYKDLYNGLNVKNGKLLKETEETKEKLKDMIGQRDRLYGAYNDISEKLKETEEKYNKNRDRDGMLVKELDKFISENAKLKEDYNKLVDENKALTETLDKLRTKPDREEAKKFFESLQQEPIKLSPVLSETPSVVINTKSINITFDNHTNNFKEDDAE